MITFKQQITVQEELVEGLATFLGYQSTIIKEFEKEDGSKDIENVFNPETPIEFIDRLAKEHTASFFKPFGEKLVQDELIKTGIDEQKKQVQEQIEAQIVTPIIEGLISDVVIE